MIEKEFIEEVKKLGINLDKKKISDLGKYFKLLISWNEKINLTSITKLEDVYQKHFYDSLTLYKAIDLTKNLKICDVGTGAGFPGIVLKIVFPDLKVTLVDSIKKRTMFLEEVVRELNLKDVKIISERGETYAKNNREKFDLVTSRAVAKLNILSEICIPLLKKDAYFIPMKANIEEEIKDKTFLLKLNASLENIISFTLPKEGSIRNLPVIKKIEKTNLIYPRNYKEIIKKPL